MVDCEPNQNVSFFFIKILKTIFIKNKNLSQAEQRKNNLINGPCPCDVINSRCINNECVCNDNFTVSKDKRRCLKSK